MTAIKVCILVMIRDIKPHPKSLSKKEGLSGYYLLKKTENRLPTTEYESSNTKSF